MSDTLTLICADKAEHVKRKKSEAPLAELIASYKNMPPTRGFIKALSALRAWPSLIAEVKKASPSRGIIREDFDPVRIARIYEESGAACLSVLTDEPYFQGHDDYLKAVRQHVSLPLLRKDFMIDPYQVHEARALGADCILIIMAALTDAMAKELYDLATSLSLDTLFEVHDEDELGRALALKPQMVGVNNRNLKTLEVSLETGLSLATRMPLGILKVAESGLSDYHDLKRFQDAGYNAFLIGEGLMREKDIGEATRKILGS
jgi:indole-3-glycerol phosphate synthase